MVNSERWATAADAADGEILHLAIATDWHAAQDRGTYPWSTRGQTVEQVGFVHCSADDRQLDGVLARFYADVDEPLVVLHLDVTRLLSAGRVVRFEPADPSDAHSEQFPHIYGGTLPLEAVSHARPVIR